MRSPTHRTYPHQPSGAHSAAAHGRQSRRPPRQISGTAAAVTAAATATAFGRDRPASRASEPAHSQWRSRAAHSDHAASAVITGSVYAIVRTTECGSSPHSSTSSVPTRRPYRRSPIR